MFCFQNKRQGSGLTGQGKDSPLQSADDGHDQTEGSAHDDGFGELPTAQDLESMSPNSKSRYWSLLNLRSDIRDAVSNIRTQILPCKILFLALETVVTTNHIHLTVCICKASF